MTTKQRIAIVAAIFLGLVIVFQLMLAMGFPLGQAAWGGQDQVLPANLRWASLASAGVLGLAAWVVLARSGRVAPGAGPVAIRVATWVFAGFLSLSTLGNIASSSTAERYVLAPVSLLIAVCFFVVALSPYPVLKAAEAHP